MSMMFGHMTEPAKGEPVVHILNAIKMIFLAHSYMLVSKRNIIYIGTSDSMTKTKVGVQRLATISDV